MRVFGIILTSIAAIIILFSSPSVIFAHPGRTSSDGCHYCWTNCSSWGFTYGTRHNPNNLAATCSCNSPVDPLYCPSNPPPPLCPALSDYKTIPNYIPNSDGKTFTVDWNWNSLGNSGYSLSLDTNQYSDPGPLIDTTDTNFSFYNVLPGQYFIHMKVGVNNQWCNPIYWSIVVPAWYQPPVPPQIKAEVPSYDTPKEDYGWIIWVALAAIGLGIWGWLKVKRKEND